VADVCRVARGRSRDAVPTHAPGSAHHRVSRDRWLVSYADFVTLLFAFFATLYARRASMRAG
jgi:flagellar motor protein MotB